jgi:hypothetical protein
MTFCAAISQLSPMMVEHCEQLLVINVPKGATSLIRAEKTQVCEQLTQANVGRHFTQLSQNGERFALGGWDHGCWDLG